MIFSNCISFMTGFLTYMIVSKTKSTSNKLFPRCTFGKVNMSLLLKVPETPLQIHIHPWLYLFLCRCCIGYPPFIYFCYGGILQDILMCDTFYQILYFDKNI